MLTKRVPDLDFDDNGFIDPVDLEMVMDTMLSLADEDDAERLSQEERICIIQKVAPDHFICTANQHRRLQVMTEGDPSITEEDQQKHGYQNVGPPAGFYGYQNSYRMRRQEI